MKHQLLGGADRERRFAIVLNSDDEIKDCLCKFASSLHGSGHVQGLGAVRRATVAFWHPTTREYERIAVEEQAEVLSLTGNLALTRDEFQLHAHIVLGLRDGRTVGGHLVNGIVHPTLEVLFFEAAVTLRREKDIHTGLDLLSLP